MKWAGRKARNMKWVLVLFVLPFLCSHVVKEALRVSLGFLPNGSQWSLANVAPHRKIEEQKATGQSMKAVALLSCV